MLAEKPRSLSVILLACIAAALFALALAGCSSQPSSGSPADSGSGSTETAADEIAIPDDLADVAAATKGVAANADAEKAEDISKLPFSADEDAATLGEGDIETGIEDQSKAPSGQTLIHTGGIEVLLSSAWNYRVTSDGWDFATRDGLVWGGIYSTERSSALVYNVEAMASSIPQILHEQGAEDVQVVNFDTRYSSSGALCDAFILCAATFEGQHCYCYYEYTLTKSHVNWMYFSGLDTDFKAHLSDISDVVDSLAFLPGEMI